MTGPSGNRLSICPLRFRIAYPRVPIDLGCASVNKNSWGGDPEFLGEINLLITLETSHYLFINIIIIWQKVLKC